MKPDAPVIRTRIRSPATLQLGRVLLVPRNRSRNARLERHLRLKTEERDRLLDGGYSQNHFGAWMRLDNDLRPRVRQADDHVRELEVGDRALRIAEVERVADSFRPLRAPEHAVDEILDVAPRAD